MHFQDQRGFARDRASEISQGSLVGCADLAQSRPASLENFRNPKSATDLNQFAARNHDLIHAQRISVMRVPARARSDWSILPAEMAKNQNKRAGIVIHHCG